jgi:hypothetical protein
VTVERRADVPDLLDDADPWDWDPPSAAYMTAHALGREAEERGEQYARLRRGAQVAGREAARAGEGAVTAARARRSRHARPAHPAVAGGTLASTGALRWTDGFVFALMIPAALVATLGYSIGALGGWGAVALWTASMRIATAANWVYAELAAMFPTTAGGISLYAHESWRERFPLAGPIGAVRLLVRLVGCAGRLRGDHPRARARALGARRQP